MFVEEPRPEATRVVLVAPPESLETAVRTALAPWHVDVVVVERGRRPVDVRDAGSLASRHDANAVAWLSSGEMVVFDRDGADVLRRPVDESADIDDASAAALA